MLVVDKENGLHKALYVEFLPRIMQRVIFCSCESNGGFSTKFTKYDSLVYIHVVCRYTCLWKASFIAWLGCSWTSTFMSLVLGQADVTSSVFWTTTQGRVTFSVYPHQLLPCPCFVYNFFFFLIFKFSNFWIFYLIVDMWCDLEVCLSCHFILRGKCHVFPFSWSRRFLWLASLPINSRIPLLPFHISNIFFFDICRPAPRLEVFSRP